jgi:transglutaminase superfamily protein
VRLMAIARRDVARFRTLTAADRSTLLLALAAQPLIRSAIKVIGFRRTHAALGRALHRRDVRPLVVGANSESLRDASQTARLLHALERRGLLDDRCLIRALTLWWLLERKGIASAIRFGVRRCERQIDAHAWVECFGVSLDRRHDVERFAPLGAAPARTWGTPNI